MSEAGVEAEEILPCSDVVGLSNETIRPMEGRRRLVVSAIAVKPHHGKVEISVARVAVAATLYPLSSMSRRLCPGRFPTTFTALQSSHALHGTVILDTELPLP